MASLTNEQNIITLSNDVELCFVRLLMTPCLYNINLNL